MNPRVGLAAALCLGVSACFGFDERLAACERGEGPCARDAGAEEQDGGRCAPFSGDLLPNGSFERVLADGGVPGWSAVPAFVLHDGGAAHCRQWASYDSPDDMAMLETDFDLSLPVDAGTRFEIGLSARSLDGNTSGLVVQLRNRSAGYTPGLTGGLQASDWTELRVTLPVAETGSRLRLELIPNAARSIALDGVFVRPAP